jgi:uncharacterized membrane protein YedE/YeeE
VSRKTSASIVAALAGLIFAIGLGLSGMTQPAKVMAFLDVRGGWDPSLAFVMVGAIAVHFVFARRAVAGGRPLLADRYELPRATKIDGRLLVGALLFGIGWAMAGFCPGPAVVSVVTLAPSTLLFVGAMAAGMLVYRALFEPFRSGNAELRKAAREAASDR